MANIWYIQVNRYCNNACHFCSNPNNGNNISYLKWLKLIDDFVSRKYSWIIFTWWEPTLSPDLDKWIQYSVSKNMNCRIISNGMMCSNLEYITKLKDAWLSLIHFSFYSYIPEIHDFLTNTPGSYKKIVQSIQNALQLWIRVQINCVINKYNQNHLDKTVKFIVKFFPQIQHFVWNNLDPVMMRKTNIAMSTLPNFDIAWIHIVKSLSFLESTWRTFRVEKLPLCFMRWFEYASTETRKIIKSEERIVYFLDNRDLSKEKWKSWKHYKESQCYSCDLKNICAWIWKKKEYYNYVTVIPQKLTKKEKQNIIDKVITNI